MDQTFSLNNMILIGSTARNSGKTTLATALVNAYQDRYPVIGLKISSIHEETGVTEDLAGGWQLIEETSRDGLKDTSKLLAAGANRVYWLKTDRANLEQGFLEFMGLATLVFDRSHFHQVLWNLLGNALRHSRRQEGSILLRVQDDAGEGWVALHAIDDGRGVDEGLREQIFEPFFTTHSRGTGLGLYIARELCEANGARLELLNSVSGADFCVSGRAFECQ